MNQNPGTAAICWMVLAALLAAVLVGCGGESAPRIPAPPPFVPASVVVQLGERGGATTLISTQAGGGTHNGQPFASGGTVRGENAATYRLTLSGDSWSAMFVPPDPVRVPLGSSGDEVTLELREDGTYQAGTASVETGHVVTAGNGNQYTLTLDERGSWSAQFLAPDPLRLALGSSGDTVTIEIREDRNFWLDDSPLLSGRVVQAANGHRYTLTFGTDGAWQAVFVQPAPQRVALGSSGRTVLVDMLESGTYQIDGGPLWAGEVREIGGFMYRFALGSDGLWSATFVAEPVTVRLGAHGGTIRVVLQENGRWTLTGQTIRSGHIVQGSNGHNYRLMLVDGVWRAEPQPMPVQVALQGTGGSIVLIRVEDGSYIYQGTVVTSGDVISVGNARYRLTQLSGGGWQAVFTTDPPGTPPGPPDPSTPLTSDSLASYVGVSPRLRLTEDGSSGTREGSILELNGLEYSVYGLFTSGRHDREITFAEDVSALITEELSDIETLIFLGDSASSLDAEIEKRWGRVGQHLDRLFPNQGRTVLGLNAPKERNGTIDYEEVVDEIRDVLGALRTSSAFETALDDGIFSGLSGVDPNDSDDIFFSVRSLTRLGFGWTTATRYGAFSNLERSSISETLEFAPGSQGIGAFAYSPLETTRTRDLPSSGEASYFGTTIAASRDASQTIFTGDIELHVRFASKQVTGLVTALQDRSGNPWRYSLVDVESIQLPNATIDLNIGSFEPASSNTARVTFSPISSRSVTRALNADFNGRFVGRDRAAGESAIGTWSLTSRGTVILSGGFGVDLESGPTTRPPPVVRPPVDPSSDLGQEAATYITARPDSNGDIEIAALDSDDRRIELPASDLYVSGGAIVRGQRLFEKAREGLDQSLQLLDVYVNVLNLGGSQGLQNRLEAWRAASQTLEDNIFGRSNALGAAYPSQGSRLSNRDEDAFELLQDAHQALGSSSSFRDAVSDGGVFENILSQSRLDDGDYDFTDIASALEYEVEVVYDHTDHTRFGVWAKQVRENALSPPTAATEAERGDSFAYSPIQQTVYASNDVNFPRGFTSTYFGHTVAVNQSSAAPTFYRGEIRMTVGWLSSGPSGSTVTTVIENLANTETGEPLLDGNYDVSDIIFPGASVELDSQNRVGFRGTSLVRVRYVDPSRSERSYGSGSTEGKFVGYDLAGTRGVVGTWEWGTIKGAFGADLAP